MTEQDIEMHTEPKLECALLSGEVLEQDTYPFRTTHYSSFLQLARLRMQWYWRLREGRLVPVGKMKRRPDLVRLVAPDGREIFRWTIEDEERAEPLG